MNILDNPITHTVKNTLTEVWITEAGSRSYRSTAKPDNMKRAYVHDLVMNKSDFDTVRVGLQRQMLQKMLLNRGVEVVESVLYVRPTMLKKETLEYEWYVGYNEVEPNE